MYNLLTCLTCNLGESTMITDPESGEVICGNCGTVAADCVEDNRNGFRGFTNGKDTSRIGPPTSLTMHDMGLYTMVGKADRDSSGQLLDLEMRSRMNRLRTWDARLQTKDASIRNFRTAFTLLNKLKDKLGLPYVITEKADISTERLSKMDLSKEKRSHLYWLLLYISHVGRWGFLELSKKSR